MICRAIGSRFIYSVRGERKSFGVQFISAFSFQLVRWVPPAIPIPYQPQAINSSSYISNVLDFALLLSLRRLLTLENQATVHLPTYPNKDWSVEIKNNALRFRHSNKPCFPIQPSDKKRLSHHSQVLPCPSRLRCSIPGAHSRMNLFLSAHKSTGEFSESI